MPWLLTVMVLLVLLLDHKRVVPVSRLDAVRVIDAPSQTKVSPMMSTVGVCRLLTSWVALEEHPKLFVPVTL